MSKKSEKILVISCFFDNINTSRPNLAYKYFLSRFETKLVYNTYSHVDKKYKIHEEENFIPINAIKYKKNISLKRIISHIDFSVKVKQLIKKEKPQYVYITIPPNILGYLCIKLCKKLNIKTIIDIVDIWPEAFPVNNKYKKIFNILIGRLWRKIRTRCINMADYIISESDYFYKIINIERGNNTETIYLCKYMEDKCEVDKELDNIVNSESAIKIAYLGSINNIYDFESLIEICKNINLNSNNKNVEVHIIGDGENRNWLLKQLNINNIKYKYYGKIFDEQEKYEILKKCNFGFNGYKENTEVALSYKSIDYLSYGLILINSAKGDTYEILKKNKVGLNYNRQNINNICKTISNMSNIDILEMRKKSYNLFLKEFNFGVYCSKMDKVMSFIIDRSSI